MISKDTKEIEIVSLLLKLLGTKNLTLKKKCNICNTLEDEEHTIVKYISEIMNLNYELWNYILWIYLVVTTYCKKINNCIYKKSVTINNDNDNDDD